MEVHDMLSVLSVDGVEQRIGEVPGVESVTVNFAAGTATVRYDETRLEIADIKSAVRQNEYESATPGAAPAAAGHKDHMAPGAPPATPAPAPPAVPAPAAPKSVPHGAAAAPSTASPAGDQKQDNAAPGKIN